jgi:adenylylsulfate kinase
MSLTLWFTGLPASGKTTLANLVCDALRQQAYQVELLDSDTFVPYVGDFFEATPSGRDLNARIMAIVAAFLNKHKIICVVAATTPRLKVRERNRKIIDKYLEVYCKCSLRVAEQRDPRGLYQLAKREIISNFTGVDEMYEEPLAPEIVIQTDTTSIPESVEIIMAYLKQHHALPLSRVGE